MRLPCLPTALLLSASLGSAGCGSALPDGELGPLQAGTAEVRMPAPVGIGTVGYGGFDVESNPSPFSEIYPATTRVHGHPDFEAVALYRGPGMEIVFLRSDTVGIFQQFRRAVVLELEERLGRPMDDVLIMGATHTHSGPGRLIDGGGVYDLIADRFHPELYQRMVDAAADAVELAYADLAEARVGWTVGWAGAGHEDRRCEDGQTYTNGDLPLIAVERGGELEALLGVYAVHGTVLDIDQLTLSQDVSGAIEEAVEARLGVRASLFNAWAADMSPAHPEVERQAGAELPEGYDQMEAVAQVVADAVEEAVADVQWLETDALVHARTTRVPIDREVLGYAEGEFDYPYGGVYCGSNLEADCDPDTTLDSLDQTCIPFSEEYPAPNQTVFTAGRIGDLWFATWPGEPGTVLAEQALAAAMEAAETRPAYLAFLGYSQDYLGYSLTEEDWWQGGYEASGALWGPRQGEYLAERFAWAISRAQVPAEGAFAAADQPDPIEVFSVGEYEPYRPEAGEGAGEVLEEVASSYGPTEVLRFTVAGGDPWLGTPVATLEHASGEPVEQGGHPITSDGYRFWVELQPDPPYEQDVVESSRRFAWSFHLPIATEVAGIGPQLEGSYRLRVLLPTEGGEVEAISSEFSVEGG